MPEEVSQLPPTSTPLASTPDDSPVINKKEFGTILLLIFDFYWICYLAFNWSFRYQSGSAISVFPEPTNNPSQFLLAPFGAFITFCFVLIYKSLTNANKRVLGKIFLTIPILLLILLIVYMFNFAHCEGELYGLGYAILLGLVIMLAIGLYTSFFLIKMSLHLVNRYLKGFPILLAVSLIILITPIIFSIALERSFKSKIVDKDVLIKKIHLFKTPISKAEYDSTEKLNNCCLLKARLSGTAVLSQIDDNRYLVQGHIKRRDEGYRGTVAYADLYVEDKNKAVDITKGTNIKARNANPETGMELENNISISTPKDMVIFLAGGHHGDAIISKLDGSGTYVDSSLCDHGICYVNWGVDGLIYIKNDNTRNNDPEQYWRITPP